MPLASPVGRHDADSALDIRSFDGDVEAVLDLDDHAFLQTMSASVREISRSVFELDRTLGAFEGATLVGSASAYSLRMTVPGGERPVAGVTWVAVLPSHRRRGILTGLMRAQLHGLHDDGGEPVAALWASEGAIYGRFGYGAASRHVALSVPRAPRALAGEPTDPRLRTRLVDPAEHRAACELVRDADRLARPGMFVRDQRWQAVTVFDPPEERQGRSALRCAVVEDGDGPRAYALYATESSWEPAGPRGTVFVREAHAADPAAYATLWRFLADMDLTVKVETGMRPQDDPLLELLLDVRSAVPRLLPALHVRLVDVGRALSSRSYAGDIDLVLDVSDAFCPWNARRWHLHGGIDGARCEPTKAGADLTLSSTELGAAYLGGTSLTSLAAAGRVVEQRAGALSVATRAFRSDLQPWCPQIY